MPEPTITRAADQPVVGGARFAQVAENNGGMMDVCVDTVGRGDGPPLHVHHDLDDMALVLSGRLTVRVDGRDHELAAGDTAFVPRGIEHGFTNTHEEPCQVVWLTAPGGFYPFIVELDALPSWDDEEAVNEVCERHRCTLTGPPLAELLGVQ